MAPLSLPPQMFTETGSFLQTKVHIAIQDDTGDQVRHLFDKSCQTGKFPLIKFPRKILGYLIDAQRIFRDNLFALPGFKDDACRLGTLIPLTPIDGHNHVLMLFLA